MSPRSSFQCDLNVMPSVVKEAPPLNQRQLSDHRVLLLGACPLKNTIGLLGPGINKTLINSLLATLNWPAPNTLHQDLYK